MPSSDTQFKPGNTMSKNGGRPKKPDWLKGKGIEALKTAYDIMKDKNNSSAIRIQAAKLIAEFDLGKPKQMIDAKVDAGVEVKNLSMNDRKDIIAKYMEQMSDD